MLDGADAVRCTDTTADRIVFVGHATVLIEVEGVRLLTDPLLRSSVAHLRRQVPLVEKRLFAHPDAVLISHLHHDHLDLASLRRLGPAAPLIVPAGAGAWLRRRGFARVTELSWGEAVKVGSLTVSAVQARHDGRRLGGPTAQSLGYLMAGGRTVYFAGDTELYEGMANLSSCLDVALVPVAGWGPTLGPGHMNPLDAANAIRLLDPRLAIPVHWGTMLPLGLGRHHRSRLGRPPREFAQHVARLAPTVEVRVLDPGQETTL